LEVGMAAIPIGGDPEDFEALRQRGSISSRSVKLMDGEIHLSFVGTFMPRTHPLMRVFLKAFVKARSLNSSLMEKVRLHFIGTSNQPDDLTTFHVRPLAVEFGITDVVRETPERRPYVEALSILANSHAVLL